MENPTTALWYFHFIIAQVNLRFPFWMSKSVNYKQHFLQLGNPLMTAFADLSEVTPPSLPYHRLSGLRGRNTCGTFSSLCKWYCSVCKGGINLGLKNPRALPGSFCSSINYWLFKLIFPTCSTTLFVRSVCFKIFYCAFIINVDLLRDLNSKKS